MIKSTSQALTVLRLISKSCQVEIVPERAQAYLMFLADHATDSGEEEFLVTVIVSIQLWLLT